MIRAIIFLIIFMTLTSIVLAWEVTITATNQLEPIVFGAKEDATTDYDVDFDVYVSTPIQDKVIMSIDNIYAKSYVGTNDELKWDIVVGIPAEQTAELEWELNDVPQNLDLFLNYNSNKINMKSQNTLQFGEGGYTLLVEAKSTSITGNNPSSSGSGGSSISSEQKQGVSDKTELDNEEKDTSLKSENVAKPTKTLKDDIDIKSEVKTTTLVKESKERGKFVGLSITVLIVVIGLLIYLKMTKINGGIKSE